VQAEADQVRAELAQRVDQGLELVASDRFECVQVDPLGARGDDDPRVHLRGLITAVHLTFRNHRVVLEVDGEGLVPGAQQLGGKLRHA